MTREERELALYCLKASNDYHSEVCEECINYPNCDHTIQDDVTETIIKALEQEPCEDAISRQAVLEPYKYLKDDDVISVWLIKKNIEQQKSVTPTRQTGQWEICQDDDGTYGICNICGQDSDFYYYGEVYKYCPNCGARMIEPKESEDKE